jgi:hypothetical protein
MLGELFGVTWTLAGLFLVVWLGSISY